MSHTADSSLFDPILAEKANRKEFGPTAIEAVVTGLFEQSRHSMLRYLASLGLSLQDGEEIVQETFLLLFQLLRQQRSHPNIRGWLFRVAHNLALKKRATNQNNTEQSRARCWEEHHDPGPSPEEQVLREQRKQRLLAVIRALPEQDQYCLYLRAEGLRYREIAEILNLSIGSVSKSLTRAIQRLSTVDYRWHHAL
jgi:RNA polymerase sigma-70 factor (ECF subfamily)